MASNWVSALSERLAKGVSNMEGFALDRWIIALVATAPVVMLFAPNVQQPADAQPVPPDVEILRDVPFGKAAKGR